MTTFLFTTLPTNDLGLPTRSLPIAAELRARGHAVVFSSPARAPSRLIADAGFANLIPPHPLYDLVANSSPRALARFFRARGWRRHGTLGEFARSLVASLPLRRAPRTSKVWNMDHAGAQMGLLDEGFVRASVGALVRTIAESRADIVVDLWNPLAAIAARALRRPLVTVIQADAHPDSRGFIWWEDPPPDLPTPAPVVNRVLAEYRLPPVTKLADLSVGELTLVVGTPATDPLPEGARVTYVGPIVWHSRDESLPASVDALSPGRPLIWVYSGNPRYGAGDTSLDSAVVIEACVTALADLDAHVVVTTGHHPVPRRLLPLPRHFLHEPYVPGPAMAERSALLIHHGGYGSCQTGLHAGKPAVILPTYSERESNARRMEAIGAAIRVPVAARAGKKSVDASAFRAAVERALTDPSYSENARRAGQRLRAYGGASLAADLMCRFAREKAR